ncbi:Uncharacterized membrane protein [Altererythrobacter xiamenensis]|uniref:Uncharacterized membrane protein n=1 Tax=Altererythrobacter xiamenensis TaxID=1316679 RepID=A0A1Y6FMD8_9SPHN|nr:DUF2177 family protein [Altererythrobacter xiamenensis]SMQ74390.1 Uncharacterized membrane protein [Altererythrobacter xiamenensis]
MIKFVVAYVVAAVAFGILDAIWLRWAGPNLYRPVIGEIMAEEFRAAPAIAFYLIYLVGMVYFAIRPGLEAGSVVTAMLNGAMLGALCYATFDLTSQAVMKVWSTHISLMDIAWGAVATAAASAIATAVTLRVTG